MKSYKSIDAYIKAFEIDKQKILKQVRAIIKKTIPDAIGEIAYGMPAYKWKGKPLFYFAAMKGHLGLYPTSGPIKTLEKDLKNFSTSKGCVRVPYNEKIPEKIIIKLLKARIKEIKSKN
jgi:uncharacterized protein YdhG (YjbR/CyaY superfamily)